MDRTWALTIFERLQELDQTLRAHAHYEPSRIGADSLVASATVGPLWTRVALGPAHSPPAPPPRRLLELSSEDVLLLHLDPDVLESRLPLRMTALGVGVRLEEGTPWRHSEMMVSDGASAAGTLTAAAQVLLPRAKNGRAALLRATDRAGAAALSAFARLAADEHTVAFAASALSAPPQGSAEEEERAAFAFSMTTGTTTIAYVVGDRDGNGDDALRISHATASGGEEVGVVLHLPHRGGNMWCAYAIVRTRDAVTVHREFEDGVRDEHVAPAPAPAPQPPGTATMQYAQCGGAYGELLVFDRALHGDDLALAREHLRAEWLAIAPPALRSDAYHVALTPLGPPGTPKPVVVAQDRYGFTVATSERGAGFHHAVCADSIIVATGEAGGWPAAA